MNRAYAKGLQTSADRLNSFRERAARVMITAPKLLLLQKDVPMTRRRQLPGGALKAPSLTRKNSDDDGTVRAS